MLPALLSISGFFLARSSAAVCYVDAYTDTWGYSTIGLYVMVFMSGVWGFTGAMIGMNGHKTVLAGGLLGGLAGAVAIFGAFFAMSLRDCDYWASVNYYDTLLLYGAILFAVIAAQLGIVVGWKLIYKPTNNSCNFRIGIPPQLVKRALIGASPGILLFLWALIMFFAFLRADFATSSYLFVFMLLFLSVAMIGGQAGVIIGWLRGRRAHKNQP